MKAGPGPSRAAHIQAGTGNLHIGCLVAADRPLDIHQTLNGKSSMNSGFPNEGSESIVISNPVTARTSPWFTSGSGILGTRMVPRRRLPLGAYTSTGSPLSQTPGRISPGRIAICSEKQYRRRVFGDVNHPTDRIAPGVIRESPSQPVNFKNQKGVIIGLN